MSTDKQGAKILARTFFNQLRASGYNSNQIIGIATELIDLVTCDIREGSKAAEAAVVAQSKTAEAPRVQP